MSVHRASAALLVFTAAAFASAKETPEQARAAAYKRELDEVSRSGMSIVDKYGCNAGLFEDWVRPFAPLDLQVRKTTYEHAAELRLFYFGVVGASTTGADPLGSFNAYACGEKCVSGRMALAEASYRQLKPLVESFRALAALKILAVWSKGEDYRVNDVFRIGGAHILAQPSSLMGFVPSGQWLPIENMPDYLRSVSIEPDGLSSLLRLLRASGVTALVRDPHDTIRVIFSGIATDEAGVLYSGKAAPPHSVGEKLIDGRMVVLIRALAPGVYFYETR
jgi:hypothetical protein